MSMQPEQRVFSTSVAMNDCGDSEPVRRSLTLEVSLMTDPCLWRWEIREAPTRHLVRSSWDEEWTAYPTQDEAKRCGLEALDRLAKESRTAHHSTAGQTWQQRGTSR